MTLAEIMFARKIRFVFDKLIPYEKKVDQKLEINFTR